MKKQGVTQDLCTFMYDTKGYQEISTAIFFWEEEIKWTGNEEPFASFQIPKLAEDESKNQ